MRVYIHILALLSALVIALPKASGDGRGATIWSEKNIQGRSTAIPANNYCTDMNNIFGDWDGKIRSIRVEAGYSCQFNRGYECGGGVLEFGRPDVILVMDDLGPLFDLNIHSARCNPITKEVAAGAEIAAGKAAITGTTALTVAIAVSIFTDTNMGGTNLSLPNDEFCYNLNYPGGAFPDFSDKARSLIVYKDNANYVGAIGITRVLATAQRWSMVAMSWNLMRLLFRESLIGTFVASSVGSWAWVRFLMQSRRA
ncbi:hypothetical protein EJ02DRAFT_454459 [Clathrospora elynae]|uniref:Uncharacterized protein n=1 Tax=Clathrospora elynae TaxID=706981 RepID=A0A6A5SR55_9PLEO|nr:hypothetical protein EJ02DRAFT_454459 [Clathrospora elynae]